MSGKFKNKYRTSSTRLQSWDYSRKGLYFITISTKNKKHYFGKINNGKVELSSIGVIADILWYEIKNHFNEVELHDFIVMPNHVHGILQLNAFKNTCRDNACVVSTNRPGNQRFQNQGKNSISSIIGSYKSAVTKHSRRLGYHFSWQSGFYDHVIRNEKSFQKISDYIKTNPYSWDRDRFHPDIMMQHNAL